jgi:hypothetical protein
MMFGKFEEKFSQDLIKRKKADVTNSAVFPSGIAELFERFGGVSFSRGLYRVIHPEDVLDWQGRIHLAFPEFVGRIFCFGFDWLGRVFALDSTRSEDGQTGVVMFEPSTGEALEIPANLSTFHLGELIEYGEAALAISFHEKWLAAGGAAPRYDQCIGYRIPMFLGGADEVENLEVSDVDVYWHLMGQLILKTKGLPSGTAVHVNKAG